MGCICICSTLHWMVHLMKLHYNFKLSSIPGEPDDHIHAISILTTLFVIGPALLSISVHIFIIVFHIVRAANYILIF
jgi:hypothetical protein